MGSGWHKESLRHSQARRLGRANIPRDSWRLSYKQLQEKGVNLKPHKDNDGDGVPNSLDCRPLNKYAQDNGEPKKAGFWDKVKEFNAKRLERAEQHKREEHEARMKEITRLKEELSELKEKKQAELLLEQEKKDLAKLKEERDTLKYEKMRQRIEKTKTFLKKAGKLVKKELSTTTPRGRKGKRRRQKPLIDLSA